MANNNFSDPADIGCLYCLWPYALIFTAAFLACLLGAAPAIGWRDGPEFVETAVYLDISHPSGSPVFSLLAKPAAWIPLGSLGFRVTVFNALAGTLALCFLAGIIRILLNSSQAPPASRAENGAGIFVALAGAAFLGLAPSFWASATEVEVYTLNLCFLGLLFICALNWSDGRGEAWLMAGGFLYGLGLGNHAALVLYAPALFAYVFLGSPARGEEPGRVLRRLGWLAVFFFLGLAVYVYLPLRALADPPLNFGDPRNWDNFWFHISDRKDAETHFRAAKGLAVLGAHLHRYFTQAIDVVYLILGLPLAAWGWLWAFRRRRAFAVAALTLMGVNSLFFIEWVDGSGLFPTYFLAFVLTSAGLYRLWLLGWRSAVLRPLMARPALVGAVTGLFVVSTLARGLDRLTDWHRHGSFLAVEAFWEDQAHLPPGALTFDVSFVFVNLAYATIYQLRPDVTRLALSGVAHPQGYIPLRPSRYPLVLIPPADPEDPDNAAYVRRLTSANFDYNIPVFAELNSSALSLFATSLEPYGYFYYRVATGPEAMKAAARDGRLGRIAKKWLTKLNREINEERLFHTNRIGDYYVLPLLDLASLLRILGHPDQAVEFAGLNYRMLGPEGADMITDKMLLNVNLELALSLNDLGRFSEARAHLETNVALTPDHYPSLALLAAYYKQVGNCGQAEIYYRRAWRARTDPNNRLTIHLDEITIKGWAECLEILGRPAQARQLLTEQWGQPSGPVEALPGAGSQGAEVI